jgi:alkyldihydroxyacetonephosphate synthase
MLDEGVLVETLETATFWSRLEPLHAAVTEALQDALDGALVLCHVSHVYETGASLYFTVAARQDADPLAQWQAAKVAASDAIRAAGATITHHHAVGTDHVRWYAEEIGPVGVRALRAVKDALDPAGVLNPGVLLP